MNTPKPTTEPNSQWCDHAKGICIGHNAQPTTEVPNLNITNGSSSSQPTKPNDGELDKELGSLYRLVGGETYSTGSGVSNMYYQRCNEEIKALITKREHLAREEGYKKGYLDCGVANIVNTEKARQAVENEAQQQLEEAGSE